MATGSMIKYFIIWIILQSLLTCHDAVDTLKPGDTLNSTSPLLSASGKFTLTFTPETIGGADNSFLAIIRVKDTPNKAWIANRDQPILSSLSPVLTLDLNNTLKITHQGGDPFVLSFAPQTNDTTTVVLATLLDSGNFVLREANSADGSTSRIFWQSFDYPVDTFLPGMKLGVNRSNGHIWSLKSWGERYNPVSTGPFTLDWDTNGHQLEIRRTGVLYWTSGVLLDGKFKFILPDVSKKLYNFTTVRNQNEDYLAYTSLDDSSDHEPEWVLYTRGTLFEYGSQVDIIRAQDCDGYNVVGGCVRRPRPSDCRGKFGDDFESKKGYFKIIKSNTSRPPNWIGTGSSDCKVTCWQDCDCLGFDFPFGNQTTGAGCQFWSVDCTFVEDITGTSSFVLLPPSKQPLPGPGRVPKWLLIAGVIFCALLVLGASFYLVNTYPCFLSGDLNLYTYPMVCDATNKFAEENLIGQGRFGPVYKGTLKTGQEIAVKKLSPSSRQGTSEFQNELLIQALKHPNLVQLFGYCIHEQERMLIYEYWPNRSLDYSLFDPTTTRLELDWNKRFSIVQGIAKGLVFLHEDSRVIHRDLKAGNVLLDNNMKPKISDFGLAKHFTEDELMEAHTSNPIGTDGYFAPEYMRGDYSEKSDVYSYGVLMLEIISGRKVRSFHDEVRSHLKFSGYVFELWRERGGRELQILDPMLEQFSRHDVLRCIHIGLLCLQDVPDLRPTMLTVLAMLRNRRMELAEPTRPGFYVDSTEGNVASSSGTSLPTIESPTETTEYLDCTSHDPETTYMDCISRPVVQNTQDESAT